MPEHNNQRAVDNSLRERLQKETAEVASPRRHVTACGKPAVTGTRYLCQKPTDGLLDVSEIALRHTTLHGAQTQDTTDDGVPVFCTYEGYCLVAGGSTGADEEASRIAEAEREAAERVAREEEERREREKLESRRREREAQAERERKERADAEPRRSSKPYLKINLTLKFPYTSLRYLG
ncbi:hypothetical protein FOL47_010620 [Perkinsus chesapeaki]|uniref:Uncharacterized protein n=1 Tax=Perkinsus chesapeaki TaxID=330153 RepID=A0A7J6L396_PERCH|nr:hypothetical protein FOL47_010620 [Perkinsus chesapeaki]